MSSVLWAQPVAGSNPLNGLTLGTTTDSLIVATAAYATPVLNGVPLVSREEAPKTTLWFFPVCASGSG